MTLSPLFTRLLALVFSLCIFVADLFIPAGISVGILYLVAMLLVSGDRRAIILLAAGIASILTFMPIPIFLDEYWTKQVLLNRLITLGAIWIFGLVSIRLAKAKTRILEARNRYVKALEEMLYMTSHRVRKPLATCLGIFNLLDTTKELNQEELRKAVVYLKSSADELDDFTRELTRFMERTRVQSA
ncbi:MAG: hypothetical protein HYZ16_03835 [Bacteroidetes bacterium]|jgi:signal transduction histidine kinase|nr:hypothetical protein [Bacteroidota bacterium]